MPTEELRFAPGQIVDGKVQGIKAFGAFVELAPGTVGLVHISEIADTYVKDVNEFLKENDAVKVKILSVDGKKIALSIKQAQPKPETARKPDAPRSGARPFHHDRNASPHGNREGGFGHRENSFQNREGGFERRNAGKPTAESSSHSFPPHKAAEPSPITLDDKIARFLKESDERMQPLKAKYEHKKRTRMNNQ